MPYTPTPRQTTIDWHYIDLEGRVTEAIKKLEALLAEHGDVILDLDDKEVDDRRNVYYGLERVETDQEMARRHWVEKQRFDFEERRDRAEFERLSKKLNIGEVK